MNKCTNSIVNNFQSTVDHNLLRNKSIMDQLTKLQDCCAKINRTVSKAATSCGCVEIQVTKQPYPNLDTDLCLDDLSGFMCTHLNGELCGKCHDHLEREIGRTLFYLTSICSTFEMNLSDAFSHELKQIEILGKYSLR